LPDPEASRSHVADQLLTHIWRRRYCAWQ